MKEIEFKYLKDPKRMKKLQELQRIDCEIRGHFLVQTINIEWFIADILTAHFTSYKDKHNQLFSYIIQPEIWFKKKIELLKKILEKYYPEFLKKYPDLIKNLENIRDFRNKIAHSNLDMSKEYLDKDYKDRIQYLSYKEGQLKKEVIKKDEFQKRLVTCTKVFKHLYQIQYNIREADLKD